MCKAITFFSLLFALGFKCGSTEKSKTKAVTSTQPMQHPEASPRATKVSGRLKAVISGGSHYGEIKSFTADKVIFHSVDYGQEEPAKYNMEDSIHDGLLMDESVQYHDKA